MTAAEIIEKYLDDAFALHPGRMTASGLLSRLADAGYEVVRDQRRQASPSVITRPRLR